MNVLQIGPLSSVGGVSVHIKRLLLLLKNNNSIRLTLIDDSPNSISNKQYYNIRKFKHVSNCIKLIKQADIIHIHSGHWLTRLYSILLAKFFHKRIIVTIHSFRVEHYKRQISLLSLLFADVIIPVSEIIAREIPFGPDRIRIKEAFIPPFTETEEALPFEIAKNINERGENKILICANAFRLTSFQNKELYGFDQCIEVARMAKMKGINILIIFVIANRNSKNILCRSLLSKIEIEKLENYIYIIFQSISFVELIKKCQIVLRPTLSDGDALTVREALYFNKKVIASDIVNRPQGTILYKSGDSLDLFDKIIATIRQENVELGIISSQCKKDDYVKYYSDLYVSCYNSHKN